ncbi:MAG TPA: CheR family methyltransferase, partial [Saprospiraceae bacterium]|nr:CheR family methyltransferase [Saprospiraceae bacterium]
QDLLINVTCFFRDSEVHQFLKTTLLPKILKSKIEGESLRVWVPACASGEEAYSIAIMISEIQENNHTKIPVQIFATDLSLPSIEKARHGLYAKQDLESISPTRLQNYFTKADSSYRIHKSVRDMVIFAPHNILSDPPFSRLDFISCCNLLIYMDTAAQKKIIATFHYALNDEGYLMLGKSETIGASIQLFKAYNTKFKIYQRQKTTGLRSMPLLTRNVKQRHNDAKVPIDKIPIRIKLSKPVPLSIPRRLEHAIDEVLIADFLPDSVVINHDMDILQFRGSTELYLTHLPGKATFNILKMARPEIAFDLRNIVLKVIQTNQRARKSDIELNTSAGDVTVIIDVVPLQIEWDEPLLLILFTKQEQLGPSGQTKDSTGPTNKRIESAKDRKIKKLEVELAAARGDAYTLAQEQESFIEELQSANEEVVSSNEEMQTVNEELETSKEEIESANEELYTTNHQLQIRNDLLNESYLYSEAILSTIHEPILVLDKELRVKSTNNAFYKEFGVTEEETIGNLLYNLGNHQWKIPRLREMLEEIITKNSPFDDFELIHTFEHIGEKTMMLNASLILQEAHREKLILLTIADVTDARKLALAVKEKEALDLRQQIDEQRRITETYKVADAYIRNVFMQAPVSIVVYKGPGFKIDLINEKGLEMWGTSYEKTINKPLFRISPELREQGIEKILTNVYVTGEPYIANEFPIQLKRDGELKHSFFNFVLNPVHDLNGTIIGITSIGTDVTQEVIARKKIEESENKFRSLADAMPQIVWTALPDGRVDYYNKQWYEFTGFEEGSIDQDWTPIMHPDDLNRSIETYLQHIASGEPFQIEYRFTDRHSGGGYKWFMGRANPIKDDRGNIIKWFGTWTEIQKQKLQAFEFENAVKQRTEELKKANSLLKDKNFALEKMNKELKTFTYVSSHDLQEPLRKIQIYSDRILEKENPNLSNQGKDYFNRMREAAKRMQKLIDDLISFSRINTNERNFELMDLNLIIQEVLEEVNEVIETKNAIVEVGKMCELKGIPFQFIQMMHNLISNALKFSDPSRQPHIEIQSNINKGGEINNNSLSSELDYCHITVSDNGIGFLPEYSERIFQLFQQLHEDNLYPGTGIGLSIVQKIVDNHGGLITATSELGKGARFDIYIPLEE